MPSRDEILAAYQAGPEATVALVESVVTTLQQEIATLSGQVAQLQARLNKDSHNSHQPPSSDGPAKRPHPRSLRKRNGKKRGGQAGHPGVTRCLVDDPDHFVEHVPTTCNGCGASLEAAAEIGREPRQVIEIPEPKPEVIEHQAMRLACPVCEMVTVGTFPPEVSQPVQYGPRTRAAAVYLQTYQLLPYERTVEALGDLFGVWPSEGTLANAQATAYCRLAPVEQAIAVAVQQADVVAKRVDETGQRVAGRTEWVAERVLSTTLVTFYSHHAKRGREAIEAIGLLVGLTGRRVHDAWAPYLGLPGLYALCNAHLLRELIGLHEDTGQAWIPK
jgi:transposase